MSGTPELTCDRGRRSWGGDLRYRPAHRDPCCFRSNQYDTPEPVFLDDCGPAMIVRPKIARPGPAAPLRLCSLSSATGLLDLMRAPVIHLSRNNQGWRRGAADEGGLFVSDPDGWLPFAPLTGAAFFSSRSVRLICVSKLVSVRTP